MGSISYSGERPPVLGELRLGGSLPQHLAPERGTCERTPWGLHCVCGSCPDEDPSIERRLWAEHIPGWTVQNPAGVEVVYEDSEDSLS